MRPVVSALAFLTVWLSAALGHAAPLSNTQLGVFQSHLSCRLRCDNAKVALLAQCRASCDVTADEAGADRADWDKNKNGVTDTTDYELAVLENRDANSGTLICYENAAVVPKNACGLANCLATRTAAQCADADGDGLRKYQETLIGTSDTAANPQCAMNSQCGGYNSECRWVADGNRYMCMARACAAGNACTAFHLEQVVQDNNEVIVRVVYDYTPTPASVMDLKISYSQGALTLVDARPLDALTRTNKALSATQNPAGFVRLTVLSQDNTVPIPFGPIVELVFTRSSALASTISFVLDDYAQSMSVAPDPGPYKAGLANDALWGSAIAVAAADPKSNRLMLYYSFDNPSRPLDYSDAKGTATDGAVSGDALCALVPECRILNDAVPADARKKAILKARYAQLQRGVADTSTSIEGVNGRAAFFDGYGNHLELPVTVNDPASGSYVAANQSFSISSWLYNEGDAKSGASGQVVFSHNIQSSELTKFGLLVVPRASGGLLDLVFFQGDVTSGSMVKQTIAMPAGQTVLQNRKWAHVGMTVDAATLQVRFYINGARSATVGTLSSSPALACPQLESGPGTGLVLHDFGADIPGAKATETLFYASAQNNLLGLEQMDLNGLSRRTLLRTGKTSAQDPDYSPITNKLVYSSSEGGNYEIWIANADGSNPVQVTKSFGDTARGIFARRPKWAPDGSGIVFESNVYDLEYLDTSTNPPTIGDNLRIRAYHLFYIAYDTLNNQVAIPLPGGASTTQLDYRYLVQNQILRDYRLTTAETDRHHYDAAWLQGKFELNGTSYLGEILFSRSDAGYRNATIGRLLVRNPINTSELSTLTPGVANASSSDVRLLTARRTTGQLPDSNRILFAQEWKSYDPATQYSITLGTEANGEIPVTLRFTPNSYPSTCWDKNRDQICQTEENRNGDKLVDNVTNKCDVTDCYPSAIRDFYVAYDPSIVAPKKDPTTGIVSTTGAALTSTNKQLSLGDSPTAGLAYVKVEVVSNLNDLPLTSGATLGTVRFTRRTSGSTGLAATQRKINQKLYTWKDNDAPVAFTLGATHFDEVQEARFSPAVDRLVLAGIADARPLVARTVDLSGTANMQKLSASAFKVDGLDWEPLVRVYPCNWVGTFRNPTKGVYAQTFRGALDELKLYSYVRPADAFASEAARGIERLTKDGRLDPQSPSVGSCTSSFDCPSHQLCSAGACTTRTCNPANAYPCSEGTCTLLPVPLDDGKEVPKWVCAVECASDSQCYEQECTNGPCTFCGAGSACIECKSGPQDLGGITVNYVEGCPDRNAFMCDQGSCLSECYTLENDTSQFLCDPATESCRQGRCVLNKWDWPDFAPATFAGLGEQVFEGVPVTIAIPQLYAVEIEAYGMEDYLHDPEVLVQGKAAGVYGGSWFDLGRITVSNKTSIQAMQSPYVLYAPYQVTDLRFQMVTPPYANPNAGATGLTTRDASFCASAAWSSQDRTLCYRRTASSWSQVGYASNVSALESIMACQGKSGCPSIGETTLHRYLVPGNQSVIVHALRVAGTSLQFNKNTICSYEGSTDPKLDQAGNTRTPIFGNLFDPSNPATGKNREASNRAVMLRTANPGAVWGLLDLRSPSSNLVTTDKAVLNCPYAEYGVATPQVAEALASVPSNVYVAPAGTITENANGCSVPKGNTQQPCFEWAGGEVSLDPYNGVEQQYRTLDFDTYHSFGFEACKPDLQTGIVDCSDTSALRN